MLFAGGGGAGLARAQLSAGSHISGQVEDVRGAAVGSAAVRLIGAEGAAREGLTDAAGKFDFAVSFRGTYRLGVSAPGFETATRSVVVGSEPMVPLVVRLEVLAARQESVTVTERAQDELVLFPDPGQRVYVRQEILDANPGRPGTPISIPGLPAETASGGIKAPQYFSPGVAGDHGEPIAQYIQVGSYLLSNNLSANAHGNGYADPNILIPAVLEGVQTDGGAFNVREGNHAESLSAIYQLHDRLPPALSLTGDYRDVDGVAEWSPEGPQTKSWVAAEAAYGNGFLNRLEHRQQYKLNAIRVFEWGRHELTVLGIGYYGFSHVPGLVPIDSPPASDTIDARQRDQTHTGEMAVNDVWRIGPIEQLQLSASFRTYNLALDSNFGDGLIRQSEFRTVEGGNATYIRPLFAGVTLLAGADYQRDAPRRLDLDHYDSSDTSVYGSFQPVTANNVTLEDTAPYIALEGSVMKGLHYYLGWRRDEVSIQNTDLLHPLNSFATLAGFNSPKGTVSYRSESAWMPTVAFSFGEAFYTNDPRIGTGTERGTPVSREHSYQAVISKMLAGIDFRVTLGHMTTEASLAKIDPDTGLQEDEGPGRNKFVTVAARRLFRWGMVQASVSKADARDVLSGAPTPEAPRLIADGLVSLQHLPGGFEARAEYEEVGAKPLGDGFTGVPVREFRGAVTRAYRNMGFGVQFLVARGYTGQTTEVLAPAGGGDAFEQIVGVRQRSYVTLNYTLHLRARGAVK